MPAILVEGGFVSNHMEAARVNRSDYRQSLAQAIARGVIKFVNAEGDRHMQLPGTGLDFGGGAPPPKAIPLLPPVPSGLAHDPANGNISNASISLGIAPPMTSTTSIHKTKKKKTPSGTNVVVTPIPPTSPTSPTSPTPLATKPETPAPEPSSTPGKSLGLAEPAAPTISPGAEKAPAEPDEPPTVNIYPTGPPPPTPPVTTNGMTNATESPAPPATHEP